MSEMYKWIILSDIHGNLSALNSVIEDFESKDYNPDKIAILGDCINYGMRPNEVIRRLISLSFKYKIEINLFGNHEKALIDFNTEHFSTERGKSLLDYTRNMLDGVSLNYLNTLNASGYQEIKLGCIKILFIHGSIQDPFWGILNDETSLNDKYFYYDYVISGHTHIPHLIERFFHKLNPDYRNKKRTIFLNPGSVGQPRNHNPKAQYLYIDFNNEVFHFNSINYNIEQEQLLYPPIIDSFYSKRLEKGI